jgi:3-phenylpropionate/trans-cinnamate dioxygenase ferredoxin reductase subunit
MSDNFHARIVIVGAGHGGGGMVAALRQAGHLGPITLIGDEPVVPYHRPPLSKAYLKGTAAFDSLKLRPESWYEANNVALRLGTTVIAIDPAAHGVTLADGTVLSYDRLVLATGSRARRLAIPGSDLAGIYHLRDLRDADAIRDAIGPGRRLAIVGGGYIGLEAAASAIALGAGAVLLERESRILARVACAPLADFFDRYHRAKGVEIVTRSQVAGFDGEGHVTGVRMADGNIVGCDAVLVGVGAQISDQLARDAGLVCEAGGVVVDDDAATSIPGIYAIGDMSWRPMPLYGGRMFGLESVPNAVEQGRRAAAHILGKPAPAHEVPWFWSDQYDLKLQIAGVPFDSHRLVVRGAIEDAKFAIFHLSDAGRVLAVEAVNMAQEFMAGRTLVGEARIVDPDLLGDSAVPIKQIVQGS